MLQVLVKHHKKLNKLRLVKSLVKGNFFGELSLMQVRMASTTKYGKCCQTW